MGRLDSIMIQVPISYGDLIDKITILRIKLSKINNDEDPRAKNVAKELLKLEEVWRGQLWQKPGKWNQECDHLLDKLQTVNEILWALEEQVRSYLNNDEWSDGLNVYQNITRLNIERAEIKRKLNNLLESELVEEKVYPCLEPSNDESKN